MTEETNAVEETAKNTSNTESNTVDLTAIYGVKAGMTRIFDESGNHVPVTVIKLEKNFITQVKNSDKDGYTAYQVGYHTKKDKHVNKATKGRLAKANVEAGLTRFTELRVDEAKAEDLGKELGLGNFTPATFVDVTGTSKGKGFQGVIKRHNFAGGPGAHGSKFHRTTGSIGNRATPGRVWKNKKLPGHMGCQTKTVQNLQVVEVNQDKGYMLIKGSIPGAKNSWVRIAKSIKK